MYATGRLMISQSVPLAKLLPFVKQCQAVHCNKDILNHQFHLFWRCTCRNLFLYENTYRGFGEVVHFWYPKHRLYIKHNFWKVMSVHSIININYRFDSLVILLQRILLIPGTPRNRFSTLIPSKHGVTIYSAWGSVNYSPKWSTKWGQSRKTFRVGPLFDMWLQPDHAVSLGLSVRSRFSLKNFESHYEAWGFITEDSTNQWVTSKYIYWSFIQSMYDP